MVCGDGDRKDIYIFFKWLVLNGTIIQQFEFDCDLAISEADWIKPIEATLLCATIYKIYWMEKSKWDATLATEPNTEGNKTQKWDGERGGDELHTQHNLTYFNPQKSHYVQIKMKLIYMS